MGIGRRFVLITLCAGALQSCHPPKDTGETLGPESIPAKADWKPDEELNGMRVTLSEGVAKAPASASVPTAEAQPMSDAAIARLLARLPDLETDGAAEFAMREKSLPPPKTGDIVPVPFPSDAERNPPELEAAGPIEVTRFAPEGEVNIAPHLSITFNQPMVPLSSQAIVAKTTPVTLTPQVDGEWVWLGTKTLQFKPTSRFPMATEFKVVVPEGVTSERGETMKEASEFTFKTPPLRLLSKFPTHGPQSRQPVIFLGFDQKIAPEKLAEFVSMKAGLRTVPYRVLSQTEAKEVPELKGYVGGGLEGNWMAIQPRSPLAKGANVTVTVEKGAPSVEGPRTTSSGQSFSFQVYKALKLQSSYCRWRNASRCDPTDWWSIEFNNPLDAEAFDPKSVKIEPALERPNISVSGRYLSIGGNKPGRTTYTVTVPSTLKDKFGQTLGGEETVTFKVGPANPVLQGPRREMVVLDPSGDRSLPIYTINRKDVLLKIHKVQPSDRETFVSTLDRWNYQDAAPPRLPGTQVFNDFIKIDDKPDELVETRIDLSKYLDDGFGQLIVWVEAERPRGPWDHNVVYAWVQSTQLALSAQSDSERLQVWATGLADGLPSKGAEVEFYPTGAKAIVGEDGLVELPLPEKALKNELLLVRQGKDLAILPSRSGLHMYYSGLWKKGSNSKGRRWFVFDDRGMYKPGETARVKGWVRLVNQTPMGDLEGLPETSKLLNWSAKDTHGNEFAKGTAEVSGLGGFDFAVELPKTINLGQARIQMSLAGVGSGRHSLKVQEFRRPEYEVNAMVDKGPHFLGERAVVSVNAAYFAGGGLSSAETIWNVRSSEGSFTPPNRSDFTFGTWRPWWRSWSGGSDSHVGNLTGKTDALGNHYLEMHVEAMNPPKPMNLQAEASVEDVNRQRWSASASLLVHPSELYVGLKMGRSVVEAEKSFDVDLIVVDLDGKAVPGVPISVTMERLEWKRVKGTWDEVPEVIGTCSPKSKEDPVSCSFTPPDGATYRLKTRVSDSMGRPNESSQRFWVPGGKQKPERKVTLEEVMLIPDRKDVQPGDTLTVLVQAPFSPAQGLMTIRRDGLVRTEPFSMEGPTHELKIPIKDAHIPNFGIQVDLVGAAVRTDDAGKEVEAAPNRPAYATGSLAIKVPPLKRALTVAVTPKDKALMPGGKTSIDIAVSDVNGKGVQGAEMAVVVVDESVLSLTGYKMQDPLALFYATRGTRVSDVRFRGMVHLEDPVQLLAQAQEPMEENEESDQFGAVAMDAAPTMSAGAAPPPSAKPAAMKKEKSARKDRAESKPGRSSGDGGGAAIKVRTNFNALAHFAPRVRTDRDGKATVKIALPDNLTRYRVMVVAVAGDKQFGKGESAITARLPIMLRPSPPRFLNFGDVFELPLVIQNQTDKEAEVLVAARATNMGFVTDLSMGSPDADANGSVGIRVRVPANDRVEVRFPATTIMAGKAKFQAAFSSGDYADAAKFELPIWTPATSEGFATYGVVDEGVDVQTLVPPDEVWPQFGGLQVSTSSTQLQALTDAVLYLATYPYDCNEQRSSRVLAIAALHKVLSEFEAEGMPSPEELQGSMKTDLEALRLRQNHDGGWAFWRKGDRSWPYLTIHVTHALVRAQAMGFELPAGVLGRAMQYLKQIERHIPAWYSQRSRDAIIGYSIMVRTLADDVDGAKAMRLARKGADALSMETLGWILPTLQKADKKSEVATITRYLLNRVSETTGNAHFTTSYQDGAHVLLHSSRRADGVLLDAFIQVDPKNDLIPKLVRGLLAHRVKGRWSSTQENAFVLLAMDRYFKVYEGTTPDFVARVWLGDGFAGEHAFKGRTTETAQIDVPMSYVAELDGKTNVVVQKDGAGRLYYRMGLNYAPKSLKLDPMDRGFTVLRSYEPVDDDEDVTRDDEGTWHIKAGASVRVRVKMVAPGRRYHVALVDPLPAGLEVLNPALAVTGSIPADPKDNSAGRYWWWSRPWYQHQNMRDERVEAFSTLVWSGVHEYTYVARATTPGRFVVPPAKAEEMYAPETFGRSATDRVVVE